MNVEKEQKSSNKKKTGDITRSERASAAEQAASVLKNAKQQAGKVIHVTISDRTILELPAHLSQEEIDARIKKHIEHRKSKI